MPKAAAVRNPILEVFFQLPNSYSPVQAHSTARKSTSPPSIPRKFWIRQRPTGQCLSGPGLGCPLSVGFPYPPAVLEPWTQEHAVLEAKPLDSGQPLATSLTHRVKGI